MASFKVDPLFGSVELSEMGWKRLDAISEAFDKLKAELETECGVGVGTREYAITKSKLEEACFYAKKSMATQLSSQAG